MPRYISRLAVRPLQGREIDWYCSANLAHHCRQGWGNSGDSKAREILLPFESDEVVAHTLKQLGPKGSNIDM